MGAANPRVNCYRCRYFYITHEPEHPYGCRAMAFKSKEIPSMAVYASSAMPCQMFSARQGEGGRR